MSKPTAMDAVKEQLIPQTEERKQSITEQIIELARANCDLFCDGDGKAYASFTGQKKERQTQPVEGRAFRRTLGFWFNKAARKVAKQEHIREAAEALSGYALYEGDCQPVYLRTARLDDRYYIDLCNDDWSVVEVSSKGWEVLESSPVKFIRTQAMRALPVPQSGGSMDGLWQFINVPPRDRLLVLAWLVESLRADTQKPIIEVLGGHGTGKSHTCTILRSLIDPNRAMLRALPKSLDDLYVSASSNWILSYENVSHLSPQYQDSMCQISTGTGYAKRELYTDIGEVAIEVKRPQMINGITPLATRQDLADRTVSITLPVIAPERRKNDRHIHEQFENEYPRLFGALLQLFADALAQLPDVRLDELPRLADFGLLGEAVGRALGQPSVFNQHLSANQKELALNALESSPAAMALMELSKRSGQDLVFNGTFKQLLARLECYKSNEFEGWPKSARGLSDVLKRQSPALFMAGIAIEFLPRTSEGYPVIITRTTRKTCTSPTQRTSEPSPNEHHVLHELHSGVDGGSDDLVEEII